MSLAAILPLVFGANLAWTDSVLGIRPIRSDSGSASSHRIRSVAELAATLELTSAPDFTGNALPADSTVRRFEAQRCKVASIGSLEGSALSLVSWGDPEAGFTLVLASGKDGTDAVDVFHRRPTQFAREAGNLRLTWKQAGKPCERFSYSAFLDRGEFLLASDSALVAFGKACRDPEARRTFRAWLEQESGRRSGMRCDVSAAFPPTVGHCWEHSEPQGEDDLDAP